MRQISAKWKWFGLGSLVSAILALIGTVHIVSDHLARIGDHPDLAPTTLMATAVTVMTFFGLLIPAMAIVGVMVVIVDGYSRSEPRQ